MVDNISKTGECLVIVGDSAFAQIAYEYFTYDSPYAVVAFSVEKEFLTNDQLFGLPVVPFEDLKKIYNPNTYKIFVAIAYSKLNRLRTRMYKEAKRSGYSLVSYISSKAFIWRDAKIGENCFVFESNAIQPFVSIGNNVILWSGNHIGHHSIIRDHCFISSHVVISGFCDIGEYCFLGVNSTISNNVKVAKNCLIGAGARILKHTLEGRVYGSKTTSPKDINVFTYLGIKKK